MEEKKMKTFFATLTIALLLAASVGILNAQETEQKTEEKPAQKMPMMGQMMGGQGGMMQGGMMGQMGMEAKPRAADGMMCPMCGKMMQGGMMGGMMGKGMMQGGMMGGMMGKKTADLPNAQTFLALTDELKLKDEQIKSLKSISLNSQKGAIRKGADLSIAKLELNALLGQDKIDLEQVQQKVKEVANFEADLQIAQVEASIKAKEVLTNEQIASFKEITKKKAKAAKKPATQKAKKDEDKPKPEATEHESHH
jgi:Spy/CpxP family protein refolding chaperone